MAKIIKCNGPIISNSSKWIYDYFDMEAVCPNDISLALEDAKNDDGNLIIKINSPGGYVLEAARIYEEIRDSEVFVEARIVGACASAATYITCAANTATMSPLGEFMIHCSAAGASGNSDDLRVAVQMLDETDRGIAEVYALKTKKSIDEIIALMKATTFMSANTALENGFVDKRLYSDVNISNDIFNQNSSVLINSDSRVINNDVILEMAKQKKTLLGKDKKTNAMLSLLKLGGKINEQN